MDIFRPIPIFVRFYAATVALTILVARPCAIGDDRQNPTNVISTGIASSDFVPTTAGTQRPFWQYAVLGSNIGASGLIAGPTPTGGTPEILVDGAADGNFWQALRYNPATNNYDCVFVSPIYSGYMKGLGLAHVLDTSEQQVVVMMWDGRVYFYDFATKAELGYINTGVDRLEALALADLDGDGRAELIATTLDDLYVFNGAGTLLWRVNGAGGFGVVAGQMDNDPAIEIATNGKVVDAATHAVQWTRTDGFGRPKLAPFPGENYLQLLAVGPDGNLYAFDVARQVTRWSINFPLGVSAIETGDIDGDGSLEVVIGDGFGGGVHVYDFATQNFKWKINNSSADGVTHVLATDADGDGVVDLVWGMGGFSSGPDDRLFVASTTGSHAIKWRSTDLAGPFLGPAIGDLDGDGQPELVVCSSRTNGGSGGRILVFDLATLKLRATSQRVADNTSSSGILDFKLRDVDGDGRMKIVIGTDYQFGVGIIEIYRFDPSSSSPLWRIWTNTFRPNSSPFNYVEVADLDNNGTRKIIGGNTVTSTGAPGVHLYIYDYPSGGLSWQSVNLASGFNRVTGLVAEDLNGDGNKEIAALVSTGDLYTWDGPSRQLRNLRQATGGTLLSNQSTSQGLVLGDATGMGHFLQFGTNNYSETMTRQLGNGTLTGISISPDGALWSGNDGRLNLRSLPPYNYADWQSSAIGNGIGRFVATDSRADQQFVFSSARHAIIGFPYTALVNAVSRKTHGASGDYDIPLPLSDSPAVECRSGGPNGDHVLILRFSSPVISGRASVASGSGIVQGNPIFNGPEMIIHLSGVADAQTLTVNLADVAGPYGVALPSASITIGFLQGDVNGNGIVNASDIAKIKANMGEPLDGTNFRSDVNTTGTVTASDLSAAKSRIGTGLP